MVGRWETKTKYNLDSRGLELTLQATAIYIRNISVWRKAKSPVGFITSMQSRGVETLCQAQVSVPTSPKIG